MQRHWRFLAAPSWPGLDCGQSALCWANRILNPPDVNPAEVAFTAVILVPLPIPESNLSPMASNLPVVGLTLWLALRLELERRS